MRNLLEVPGEEIRRQILGDICDKKLSVAQALVAAKEAKVFHKFQEIIVHYTKPSCPIDPAPEAEESWILLRKLNLIALSFANLDSLGKTCQSLKGKANSVVKIQLADHNSAFRDLITSLVWREAPASGNIAGGEAIQSATRLIIGDHHLFLHAVPQLVNGVEEGFLCEMKSVTTLILVPSESAVVLSNAVTLNVLQRAIARVPLAEQSASRVIFVERSLTESTAFMQTCKQAMPAYNFIGCHQLEPVHEKEGQEPNVIIVLANVLTTADLSSNMPFHEGKKFRHGAWSTIRFNSRRNQLYNLLNLQPFQQQLLAHNQLQLQQHEINSLIFISQFLIIILYKIKIYFILKE